MPTEIRDLVEPFRIWQEGIVDRERRSGRYVMPGAINQAGLTNAMDRAQAAIQRGDPSGYRSSSQIATAMRLHHSSITYYARGSRITILPIRMEAEDSKSKSAKDFLRDPR